MKIHGSTMNYVWQIADPLQREPPVLPALKAPESVFDNVLGGLFHVVDRANTTGTSALIEWSRLNDNGCVTPSGTRDCSAACGDPSILFSSLDTLGNCVMFSAAALGSRQNGTAGLAASDIEQLNRSFGISDLTSFDAGAILSSVTQCAVASCQETGPKRCSQTLVALESKGPIGLESLPILGQEFQGYCNNTLLTSVSIAADIAGPGVSQPHIIYVFHRTGCAMWRDTYQLTSFLQVLLSHIIQTIVVVIFFALMNIFNFGARALVFFSKHTEIGDWRLLRERQSTLFRSDLNSAILSTAVELQEAQVYFTLAIQIAALVSFRPLCEPNCAGLNSVASIGEGVLSSSLLRSIVQSSILPVLLMQSSLQRSRMRWWYNLMLTAGVCIPAVIVHFRSGLPPLSVLQSWLKDTEPISKCGGNPALTAYCLEALPDVQLPVITVLPIALVTVAVLLADQVVQHLQVALASRFRGLYIGVLHILLVFLETGLLAAIFLHLNNILRLASGSVSMAGVSMAASEFTYGQLIAAMVWAPVLGKFIYYNICESRPLICVPVTFELFLVDSCASWREGRV